MLSAFTLLCNQSPKFFSPWKTKTLYPLNNNSPLHSPLASGNHCSREEQIWLHIGSVSFTSTFVFYYFFCKLRMLGASLVAKWLGVCLLMQGTWVRALAWEDPACRGATGPVHYNCWAWALEPASHNYWAHVPQLLKPACLEPVLHNEKPQQWEAHAPQWRVAPTRHNWRKLVHSSEDPTQPEINK